jgi:hypothetical protein
VLVVAIVALVLGGIGLEQYLTGPHALSGFGRGFRDIVFYDLQLPVSPLWARFSCCSASSGGGSRSPRPATTPSWPATAP